MDNLTRKFNWNVLEYELYDSAISRLQPQEIEELNITLRNVCRHLEVICINMKHEIIEEDMCYDYLRSILTTFYFTCVPFFDEERRARREPAVFIEFEQYAERWLIRGGRQSPRLTADNPSRDFPHHVATVNSHARPIAA